VRAKGLPRDALRRNIGDCLAAAAALSSASDFTSTSLQIISELGTLPALNANAINSYTVLTSDDKRQLFDVSPALAAEDEDVFVGKYLITEPLVMISNYQPD